MIASLLPILGSAHVGCALDRYCTGWCISQGTAPSEISNGTQSSSGPAVGWRVIHRCPAVGSTSCAGRGKGQYSAAAIISNAAAAARPKPDPPRIAIPAPAEIANARCTANANRAYDRNIGTMRYSWHAGAQPLVEQEPDGGPIDTNQVAAAIAASTRIGRHFAS